MKKDTNKKIMEFKSKNIFEKVNFAQIKIIKELKRENSVLKATNTKQLNYIKELQNTIETLKRVNTKLGNDYERQSL